MSKNSKIYLATLIILSAILNYLLANEGSIKTNPGQTLVMIMMFTPAISYFVLKLIQRKKVDNIGFKFRNYGSIIKSYLLPFLYVSLVYAIIWGLGYYNNDFKPNLLIIAISGSLVNSIVVIGEEIGWRGFLLNEFSKNMSPLKSAIIVGLIWSVWHVPGLIFTDYGNTSNLILGIPFFVVSLTMISIPMSYYVFKAKNIWPAVLMHSCHNALIQAFYEPLTVSNDLSRFLKDETGLILMLVSSVIGVIYAFRMNKEKQATTTG